MPHYGLWRLWGACAIRSGAWEEVGGIQTDLFTLLKDTACPTSSPKRLVGDACASCAGVVGEARSLLGRDFADVHPC